MSSQHSLLPASAILVATAIVILLTSSAAEATTSPLLRRQQQQQQLQQQQQQPSSSNNGGRAKRSHRTQRDCRELTEEEKAKLAMSLQETTELHETFYQMDGLRDAFPSESFAEFKASRVGPHRVHRAPVDSERHRRLNCKDGVVHQTAKGNATDPCPVSWVLNVDHDRIPSVMMEARCLPCRSCLSDGDPNSITRCSAVVYYTRVQRKTFSCDARGEPYNYVPVWEPLTAGCACRSELIRQGELPNGTGKTWGR